LIRVEPVGALDDEIADFRREVLRLLALQSIAKADERAGIDTHAPRALAARVAIARYALATGARIDSLAGRAERRVFELASRAGAGVGAIARDQAFERRRVGPGALACQRTGPSHAKP
jgi:hypothetical protein